MAPIPQANLPLRLLGLFPQLGGRGGIQTSGRETAAALDEIAQRSAFATSFLSLNDPSGADSISFADRNIHFVGFARNKPSFVLSAIRRVRAMPRTGSRLILAFHPNLAPPASWAGFFAAGPKIAAICHGVDVWQPLSRSRRHALQRAGVVLAPSRFTCEALHTVQAVSKEKIQLLPWPLPPSILALSDSSSSLVPPPEFPCGLVILGVARWSASDRYKGADELIRVVAQLRPDFPPLQLVLAGDGDDVPRLRSLVRTLGCNEYVSFLHNLSDKALAACYASADIFALPSTGEGFGLVFLEAMAFAKPVVAARAGGATDIIQDGVNGLLVEPNDSQGLSRALVRLLRDEALRQRLGRSGAEIVRRDYSFSSFVTRLETLLQEVKLL